MRGDTKASRGDLLDLGYLVGAETRRVFAAFTRVGTPAKLVHRLRQSFVRFGGQRTQRHTCRIETLEDVGGGVDLADTFDNFLVLLTTQLQNQDPLSPLDTNEFTQQLVEFTNVEQAIKTNDKLDQLVALQGAGILTGALDYIGKQVEFQTDARQTPLQANFPDHDGGSVALFAPGLQGGVY